MAICKQELKNLSADIDPVYCFAKADYHLITVHDGASPQGEAKTSGCIFAPVYVVNITLQCKKPHIEHSKRIKIYLIMTIDKAFSICYNAI